MRNSFFCATLYDVEQPDKFQLSLEELRDAERRLAGLVRQTPLLRSADFGGLFFKTESLQLTGSFKLRTAYGQMVYLSDEQRHRGIVTSSSGNFAQGVALAARELGVSAQVVMMRSSNPLKVERTRELGADVLFCEDRFEARQAQVEQIHNEDGRTKIHPYDDLRAIAGNSTIGLEFLNQTQPGQIQRLVAPVSGGGMLCGIALAVKQLRPEIEVIGVQPEGSNATARSFQNGEVFSIERAQTIADGLMVTSPGKVTFPILKQLVDRFVTVSEEAIFAAVGHFLRRERLVVEPSGAVPLAAVMEGRVPAEGTALVISGGNIDPNLLRRVVS